MLDRSVGEGKILIVGECPSRSDDLAQAPFRGMTGKELDRMLHDAGILRTDCHVTFVLPNHIPGYETKRFFLKHTRQTQIPTPELTRAISSLTALIEELSPNIIITLGDLPLWALTGELGITKWRGSILETEAGTKLLPTYSPDVIARKFDWRFIMVQDLRRAKKESEFPGVRMPDYDFLIRPNFESIMEKLDWLLDRANRGGQ